MHFMRQWVGTNIGKISVTPKFGKLEVYNLRTLINVDRLLVFAHS